MSPHRAKVCAVQSHTHICVNDGHVLHPAVGSGPKVQRIVSCLCAEALERGQRELNGQVLNTN
jgi:hypothetical protein